MKVSLNAIKQFLDFDLPPIGEIVHAIETKLGNVAGVESLGEKYKEVIVAKVVSCVEHPDSDHMHVCMIDDDGRVQDVARDENGYVQVVCGASNVRQGMLVAWLPPGSTVPESFGADPFVLGTRELRGMQSNGMLASPRELALGDSHEGILDIDKDVQPGSDFAPVYKLNDYVIELENKMFTHRPDCFGVLGVAREIAGIFGHAFTSPEWYKADQSFSTSSSDLRVSVTNEIAELVPRFSAIALSNVTVGPSPVWLQVALAKVGQKSINNVVDLTNFYMLVTGQPLHAYDYDKVCALTSGNDAEITVRYPRAGETIALLNGKTIEPRSEAIMITSGEHLIGVGGVMGGSATEVDDKTTRIIVECASFDMYSVRRTSMAHGLFTDAVTRFNKGQSPLQNLAVLAKITTDLAAMAGAEIASELVDISEVQGRTWVHPPVPVTASFINARLGLSLTPSDMQTLLQNVECTVTIENDTLQVTAPFWRTDIEQREDVVEEVGRLYGFDKLPVVLPQRSIKPADKSPLFSLKSQVRDVLSRSGANEVLSYSFVHGNLIDRVGANKEHAFQVSNALSPDLQYYRLDVLPSLLDTVHANIKAGYDEFALFEIGKGHNLNSIQDDDGLPVEHEMIGLVYAAADKIAHQGAAFFQAKLYAVTLANHFGIELEFRSLAGSEGRKMVRPYDVNRAAQIFITGTDTLIGMIGEFDALTRKALKLPVYAAGFGLQLPVLLAASAQQSSRYRALPRFPKVSQDITLKVLNTVSHFDLYSCVKNTAENCCGDNVVVHTEPLDMYRRSADDAYKQVSFRITVSSYEKTLTEAEVSAVLDSVATAAYETFKTERV